MCTEIKTDSREASRGVKEVSRGWSLISTARSGLGHTTGDGSHEESMSRTIAPLVFDIARNGSVQRLGNCIRLPW